MIKGLYRICCGNIFDLDGITYFKSADINLKRFGKVSRKPGYFD